MRIGILVSRCALGVALAACTRTDGRAVMDDSTFVAAMARLHVIDRKYELSDAARDSLRRTVLQEQGLTADELERQARHYAANPARASAIWSEIGKRSLALLGDTTTSAGQGPQQEQTR